MENRPALHDYPVNWVFLRAAHHSGYSGYDPVSRYFGRRVPGPAALRWPPGRIPALANVLSATVSQSPWYTFSAFRMEMSAALDMASRRGEIYHILYGDNDCRYLPWLDGFREHRVIATYHQPPSELRQGVQDATLQKLAAVFVVAGNQVDYMARRIGADRVYMVPHGVDTGYFSPETLPKASPPVVLSVGAHLRDFPTLVRASSSLREKAPEAKVVVITNPAQAYYFAALPNVQVYSGVPDDDLLQWYRRATVAVFPMRDCTANNAVLEAMACGVPIVVTDIGGIRDYVNEQCAALVRPADPEGLAATVSELLNDPAARERLSVAARAQALRFDFACVAEQMRKVYNHLA